MGYITIFTLTPLDPSSGAPTLTKFLKVWENGVKFSKLDKEQLEFYREEYLDQLKSEAKRRFRIAESVQEEIDYAIGCGSEQKWRDHENDMKHVSSVYPEFIFQLRGQGERHDDLWQKFFYNGKMQGGMAKIILPELDLTNGWK